MRKSSFLLPWSLLDSRAAAHVAAFPISSASCIFVNWRGIFLPSNPCVQDLSPRFSETSSSLCALIPSLSYIFCPFLSPPSFLIFSFVRLSYLKITCLNFCISFSATFLSLYTTLQPSLKAVPASSVLFPCLIHSNPVSFPIAMTQLYLLSILMSNRFPTDEYFSAPFMSDVSKVFNS